jgi:hypothetical protein
MQPKPHPLIIICTPLQKLSPSGKGETTGAEASCFVQIFTIPLYLVKRGIKRACRGIKGACFANKIKPGEIPLAFYYSSFITFSNACNALP